MKSVKVIVLCMNSSGEPEFFPCTLSVTAAQRAHGEHYQLAIEQAEGQGYQLPMIAFDEHDPAARQLGELLAWS